MGFRVDKSKQILWNFNFLIPIISTPVFQGVEWTEADGDYLWDVSRQENSAFGKMLYAQVCLGLSLSHSSLSVQLTCAYWHPRWKPSHPPDILANIALVSSCGTLRRNMRWTWITISLLWGKRNYRPTKLRWVNAGPWFFWLVVISLSPDLLDRLFTLQQIFLGDPQGRHEICQLCVKLLNETVSFCHEWSLFWLDGISACAQMNWLQDPNSQIAIASKIRGVAQLSRR